MTIDEWNGTVAIDVEDILRCLFEALAIRYISMAPFLTSRVSLLSLSDKGEVLGHVGDVRRVDYGYTYATGSFCSSSSMSKGPIPPSTAGGLWWAGVECAICFYDHDYGG